ALGLGVPIVPVSTLASLAATSEIDGPILALLDARRGQVYGAIYTVGLHIERRSPERVTELATLLAELDETEGFDRLRPIGPGCQHYLEELPEPLAAQATTIPGPSARGLWRAAVSAQRAGEALDPEAFAVSYLRQSYAEMGITTPKRPMYKSPFV